MNRLLRFFLLLTLQIALLTGGSIPFGHAQNPAPTPQQAAPGKGNTVPQTAVPQEVEIDSLRPPVETAAIEGVSPGTTTTEQLTRLWGEPIQETIDGDRVFRRYSIEPLNHIEVTLRGGIVRSIVIQLDTPFPKEDVRAALFSELLRSKPVQIPDESGVPSSEIYPEKGVMFLFAPPNEENKLLVQRIAVEPISADPFVIRAEAILYDQPTEAKRDLMDAVRLKSDHAKAHWLLAQIELWEGHVESALLYNEKAIQLDEQKPSYHLTFVQAMVQMNRIDEAKQYLQETISICDRYPHEKARALMMLGELYRSCRQPDYELAYECHAEAIKLATALLNHSNQTVRLTAKDVLFEAHLETAKAVAWGPYAKKEEAIKKWIDRARELAHDTEMTTLPVARRYSRDYQFKIAACSLITFAAIPEQLNIELDIEDVIEAGNALIKSTTDPILRAKYHWDTGISLYDAVQIFQLRGQYSAALKYGELAAKYLEIGVNTRKSDTDMFLLGRLYFRLGAIYAVGNKNHRAAIAWYDLAKPIQEKLLPKIGNEALGLFGKQFVSMGVSYWDTNERQEAIQLTERGLRQILRGVRAGVVPESELVIPYSNLAKMYDEMGDRENALKYASLAESIGNADKRQIQ